MAVFEYVAMHDLVVATSCKSSSLTEKDKYVVLMIGDKHEETKVYEPVNFCKAFFSVALSTSNKTMFCRLHRSAAAASISAYSKSKSVIDDTCLSSVC